MWTLKSKKGAFGALFNAKLLIATYYLYKTIIII